MVTNVDHKRAKGNKGEDIACIFIEKHGFNIICRNFQRKWGELDIIAEKAGITHFFEVKSVTGLLYKEKDNHRPEDNVDGWKMKHLRRIIETYLSYAHKEDEQFQFHVLCVYMDLLRRRAKVKWLENLII